MEREPVIGVLGGMGPYAGLDLVSKVFSETIAGSDQDHLPVALLSYGHTIQDRSAYVLGRIQENPGIAIAAVAIELDKLGATVAGMSCNSAHMPPIFDVLMERLRAGRHRIRILHLIHETIRHVQVALPRARRIGPLSTLGTFRQGVYEKAIKAAGLIPVMPSEEVQDKVVHRAIYDPAFGIKAQSSPEEVQDKVVHRAIYDPAFGIKAQSSPVTARASHMVRDAMKHLRERGAEVIILGCTELPLAVADTSNPTIVDPARALARALIRETYPEKLRPL